MGRCTAPPCRSAPARLSGGGPATGTVRAAQCPLSGAQGSSCCPRPPVAARRRRPPPSRQWRQQPPPASLCAGPRRLYCTSSCSRLCELRPRLWPQHLNLFAPVATWAPALFRPLMPASAASSPSGTHATACLPLAASPALPHGIRATASGAGRAAAPAWSRCLHPQWRAAKRHSRSRALRRGKEQPNPAGRLAAAAEPLMHPRQCTPFISRVARAARRSG
jgi:hypothetical protein